MARFSYVTHREFPFWVGEVWDFDTGLGELATSKRFLTRRRAVRWAVDQWHLLERQEFHRQMAALTNGVAA